MSTTPTPQSDQAATTPEKAVEWLNLTSHMLQYGYEMGEGRTSIDVADRITMRQIAALLRAQSAELLALRADKARLDWLDSPDGSIQLVMLKARRAGEAGSPITYRQAIDAALNSPTQGAK